MGVGAGSQSDPVVSSDITLKFVQDIPVGSHPDGLVIDARGRRCVVANSGSDNATIIDVSSSNATNEIDELIDDVNKLFVEGKLNKGQANSLTAKLSGAKKAIEKGNIKAAINKMEAFINEVESMINYGILSEEDGQPLIDKANEIIAQLQSQQEQQNTSNEVKLLLPESYDLKPNYPNPFNLTTTISFDIPKWEHQGVQLDLKIYNIMGQLVATLISEVKMPGSYQVSWNGHSDRNFEVASGIYICHLKAGQYQQVRKIILMK
jgi:hypothetical protein